MRDLLPTILGAICMIVLFVSVAAILLLGVLRRPTQEALRRRDRGLCLHCGYDLRGNTSGVCPECGKATYPRASPRSTGSDRTDQDR